MGSEEPKVDELKRLLRRLEKIESLTDVDLPETAPMADAPRPPVRKDALASLRTPLPSSPSFFPAPPPMPDPAADLPPGLLAKPDTLPRPQPIAPAPVEKGRQRTVMLFVFLMLAVIGGAAALLMSGQLDQPTRVATRTPTVPSPVNPTPATVEAPPAPVAAAPMAVAVTVATSIDPSAEKAAPAAVAQPAPSAVAPIVAAPEPAPLPKAVEAPPPADWAKSPSATPVAGLEATAEVFVPTSPFASREALALTNEAPAMETRPFYVPAPVPAVPPAPAIIAVLQPPVAPPAPEPTPAPPPVASAPAPTQPEAPQGPRLVAGETWTVPAGIRVGLPVRIEPESAAADHYVLITGLEPDSYVSPAVEVIGGTWMIKGTDLGAAQLERSVAPPKRVEADVQLRANSGEIVSRTPLTVLSD